MVEYQPLRRLLSCDRPDNLPLALVGGEVRTWGDWRQRVDDWRQVISQSTGETWALYHNDSFEFSAILFALWAEKRIACVPGSNQKIIVESLREHVDGFVGDFAHLPTDIFLPNPTEQHMRDGKTLSCVELDDNKKVLEIYTSGSSGEPQAIDKALFQIAEEINNLQALWSNYGRGAMFFSSVSHHHIYGMLFKVFWPLAAGYQFDSDLCETLDDIPRRLSPEQQFVLISSPSHLSRIPERNHWAQLSTRCAAVFSSGAPLSLAASLDTKLKLDFTPIEVYGSSETGGIATRQQQADVDVLWQPVPGIQLSLEDNTGCLQIRSRYLPPMQGNQWYLTSDRVRIIDNNQFRLLGRVDRIVKIEGKRISLTAMEKRLETHDWVEQVKLVVLQRNRTEIGAVVVLTELGNRRQTELGKRKINIALRGHLLDQFERAVVPRRWRFPVQLPFDKQGKLPQHHLLAFFTNKNDATPQDVRMSPIFPENPLRKKRL